MTRTQEFIKKNAKLLTSGADFFNPDTSLMSVEDFEKSKLKMLLILPTPHVVKTVSSTVSAINDYIITHCEGVFLDIAYMPENEDIKRYDEWNVPYAIGNITHLDPSHFDVVGFSISVLNEVVTAPCMLSTFDRCDKPISLFWSQRKDLPLGEQPIIYAGGITAACGESMFGKVKVNGKVEQAYLDFLYLGDCGQSDILFNRLIQARETGKCLRKQTDHNVPGCPETLIPDFQEECIVRTNQEYVESLFDLQEIYQPQAYEVEYNKFNRIIKNVKINPKAQDFVTPYYPHKLDSELGIGRAVIQGNGDNSGVTQTQVGEGAHMKGNLIRTDKGLVRIETICPESLGEAEVKGVLTDTTKGINRIHHSFNQGEKPVKIFTLKSGIRIGLTGEHPIEQWEIGKNETWFKRADEVEVGDYFITKPSDLFGNYPMTTDEAEFLGRMLGDGSYNLSQDCREGLHHKMYLSCAWSEVEYCERLLDRASISYTKDETQGRHCRFWIHSKDKKGRSMREFWTFNKQYTKVEGKPSIKYVPDAAFQLNKECMKSFLKGYHDADGCTSTKHGLSKVTFDCCHESIIDIIQQMLLMVGIPSRKYFNQKSRVADEEYGFYDTINEHWSLCISSEYFDKFNDLGVLKVAYGRSELSKEHLPYGDNISEVIYGCDISTEQRSHAFAAVIRGHFTKALASKCGIKYPDWIFDEVVKIEESVSEVFDVSVSKVEKLVANGVSVHNCSSAGACSFAVAAGTRLWTNKGLLKIEDAADTTLVQGLMSERFARIDKQGEFEEIVVSTKDGHQLHCDINHKFMVVYNDRLVEKTTSELLEGDVILRKIGNSLDGVIQYVNGQPFDEEFAELLGFLHGDGCFDTKYHRWKMYATKEELEKYEESFRKIAPSDYRTRVHYTSDNTTIYVIEAPEPTFDVDLGQCACGNLAVPEIVFKSPKKVISAYLRGIFQADGWFNSALGLTSISENYVRDIALLLSYLGIDSTIRKNGYFDRMSLGGHKASWYVQIPKDFQQKFIDVVGFVTKNHEVSELSNRTKANLYNTKEIQGIVRENYTRAEARAAHIEDIYDAPRNRVSDAFWRRLQNTSLIKKLPQDSVARLVASGEFVTDTIQSVEETGQTRSMYDVVNTETHLCVYDEFLTHQCAEGNYCGGHVERTHDQITKISLEAKKYSAGYKYKPYSFNVNYLTDYKGMLRKWIQMYPKVTFINMRMEELGRDVDALKMMKLVGSNRLSAPLEGMSPRIMNNFLNKCLSEESIDNVMSYCVHGKMTDVKIGGIFTSYEEDKDFQWMCDFFDKYNRKAAEEGGNFTGRLKFTPLVHYSLTPIEYLERKSARNSFEGKRWLSDEWYEKFKEHNISFKVNGFRYSTFLEQSFIDMGRNLTDLVYKHFVSTHAKVYSLRSCATDEFLSDLRRRVNPLYDVENKTEEQQKLSDKYMDSYFGDREIEHYISPCHRIHIDLLGSYVPRARRLLRYKKENRVFENPPDVRCLRTYEGSKPKCYKNCIAKDPLKIYKDVTLDEEGLHGEYTDLIGCSRCKTEEERKWRLTRDLTTTANTDILIGTPRMPQVQKIRFVIERSPEYDVLNPNNTAHTFITKLLQHSDVLLNSYHSVVNHNMMWQAEPQLKFYTAGYQVVDTMWTKDVISEVQSKIEEANKDLKSVRIISATEILREEKLLIDDLNFYMFESTIDREQFKLAEHLYKGQIKVQAQVQGFALTDTEDKSLRPPLVATKDGKTKGVFCIPAKYNPVLYLMGYLSTVKKTSEDAVVSTTNFSCLLSMRENKVPCRNCNTEKALISMISGKPMSVGKECLKKALFQKIIK